MRRRLLSCVLTATALLATACSSGGSSGVAVVQRDYGSGPKLLVLQPGQVRHDLNVDFQFGAFQVTIGTAVYDPAQQQFIAGVRFRNTAGEWNFVSLASTLRHGADAWPLLGDTADVPPGAATDMTVSVGSLSADPFTDGSTWVWGDDDEAQAVINLADGTVTGGQLPVDVALDTWGSLGKYAVHVTGARILSGSLGFNVPPGPGERVLRVLFDVYTVHQDPVNGFYPIEHLTLKRPDGTTVEGTDSSDGFSPVSWTAAGSNWIDFPVADSVAGDYQLQLASLSPMAMGSLHPELIERTPIALSIPAAALGATAPVATPEGSPPIPDLDGPSAPTAPIELDLDVPTMNVPTMNFQPHHLSWDPTTQIATVTGDASVIADPAANVENPDLDLTGGLLDITPQFSFTHALASAGRFYTGVVNGPVEVPPGPPVPMTIEFDGVNELDAGDIGLYIGSRNAAAASVPLTARSPVIAYPPAPQVSTITAPPATAGDWTVQLVSYRVGMMLVTPPPAGQRQLELTFDTTVSPTAHVKALGLAFHPSVQLFFANEDGYLGQAVADSNLLTFNPGETHRQTVVFNVPDSFVPGTLGLVLRGADETLDVTTDVFVETTFVAKLNTPDSPMKEL